jgi:hypothetical protein
MSFFLYKNFFLVLTSQDARVGVFSTKTKKWHSEPEDTEPKTFWEMLDSDPDPFIINKDSQP